MRICYEYQCGEIYAFSCDTNYASDPELVPIYEQATVELRENGEIWYDKSSNEYVDYITREKYNYFWDDGFLYNIAIKCM